MLHFCDGFDSYTETADLVKHKWHKYNQFDSSASGLPSLDKMGAWEWNAMEGVNGGGCIKHVGAAIGDEMGVQFSYYPPQFSGRREYRTLFWFKIDGPPAAREKFCEWAQVNGAGSFRIGTQLFVNPDGTFEITAGEDFAQYDVNFLYANTFNICDNEWHCLELDFDYYDGFLLVSFDGNKLYDGSNAATGLLGAKTFTLYSMGVDTWVDDLIIWDSIGDSPEEMPWGDMVDTRADEFIWDWYNEKPVNPDLNNFPERGQDDFFYELGPRQITTLRPVSDGIINDFDLVGGDTKVDAVDDAMPDLTKYLEESVPGARMLFNMEEFQQDVSVYSVVVKTLNVMADFGSVVAHAEALVAPDFELGIRRRISGDYDHIPSGANLVPNGGPSFVDTTDWTAYADASVSVVDGRLRISHTSESGTDPDPMAEIAVPVTPGTYCRVSAQRPIRGEDELSHIRIRGATISGELNSIDVILVETSETETSDNMEIWSIPPDVSTLYLQLYPLSASTPGYVDLDWISVEEVLPGFDFKHYQWAFRYNPATLLEWDQAGINSAEFGIRIAP